MSERTYTRLELISHPPHYPPFAWEQPSAPTNPLDHNAPLRELVKARLHAGRTVADNARRLRWKRRKSGNVQAIPKAEADALGFVADPNTVLITQPSEDSKPTATQTTQEPTETPAPSAKQEGGEP